MTNMAKVEAVMNLRLNWELPVEDIEYVLNHSTLGPGEDVKAHLSSGVHNIIKENANLKTMMLNIANLLSGKGDEWDFRPLEIGGPILNPKLYDQMMREMLIPKDDDSDN